MRCFTGLHVYMLALGRYLFLFDKVVIVCKRKGYNYELKEIIELLFHKMTDDPMNNKDIKKVGGPGAWLCWRAFWSCLGWSLGSMFPLAF